MPHSQHPVSPEQSRMMCEEMTPRRGCFPGFVALVELAALAVLLALALKASQYPARCWLRLGTFRRLARSCLPSLRSGPLVFPRWLPPRPIELAA